MTLQSEGRVLAGESQRLVCVLLALLLLTSLTVGLAFLHMDHGLRLTIALGIAAAKTALVAAYFMDLVSAPKAIWTVVIVALFWLIAVLFGLTFADYGARSLTSLMPR